MSMNILLRASVVMVLAGSVSACSAKAGRPPSAPVVIAPSSGNPSAPTSGAPVVSADHVIPDTPFKYATADQIVQAWTAEWHPRIQVIQTGVVHIRRATIDNPFGPGTLQMDAEQRGTGTDPGAVLVGCVLTDPSAGKGLIKTTPKMLTTLVRDCFSPALSSSQLKTTSSWMVSRNPSHSYYAAQDFPGLHAYFSAAPGKLATYVMTRP
ncbi:hypothetical protein [Actinoplanes sp. NPDC051411]|uniref:hypothetical protein n=1 Tax=Actinoplanes sp. NPDC051411 TaxID=3155522 RepID=UPI00342AA3A3